MAKVAGIRGTEGNWGTQAFSFAWSGGVASRTVSREQSPSEPTATDYGPKKREISLVASLGAC